MENPGWGLNVIPKYLQKVCKIGSNGKWKMKEEVNLGSRHRNQYIENAKRRSDQPSEHRSSNKLCCATCGWNWIAEHWFFKETVGKRGQAKWTCSLSAETLRSVITDFSINTCKVFGEVFYSHKCNFREMSVIYSGQISAILLETCSESPGLNELTEQFGQTHKQG